MSEIATDQNRTDVAAKAGSDLDADPESDARADAGADTGLPGWAAGLSEENRQLVLANNWASEDALEVNRALDAYRDLETEALRSVPIPGENASAEERDAFERRLGRPENPEGYRFALPQGLPDDFPYSAEMAERFRDWAFRAGLPDAAAQSLHDDYVRELAGLHEAETAKLAEAEGKSHGHLTAEWGAEDSEAYRRNVLLADRAMSELGLAEVLSDYGLMAPDGGVRDARIALALARVGSELFAEDGLYGRAGGEVNPFSGDNPNLTEQSRLIREARRDPARAAHVRALMAAAGIDPEAQRL